MNSDVIKQKLNDLGAVWYELRKKLVMPCPFCFPARLGNGESPANFVVDKVSGNGECVACHRKGGYEEFLGELTLAVGIEPQYFKKKEGQAEQIKQRSISELVRVWRDFRHEQFEWNETWIVKSLIPSASRGILAGASGEGKTWVGLFLAKAVASGTPFLNHAAFSTTQCKVLYLENETTPYLVQKRGSLVGFNDAEDAIVMILSDRRCPPLNTDGNVDALFEYVKYEHIGLVIIDTLRSVSGGLEEDRAELVRVFLDRFKKFNDIGVTVLLLDHCRKPNAIEVNSLVPKKEQIIGSQDKVAAVDFVLMMRSKNSKEGKELYLYEVKNKAARERAPFKAIMRDVLIDGEPHLNLTYAGDIEEKTLKIDEAKNYIKQYLGEAEESKTSRDIVTALQGDAGKTNVELALQEMRKAKEIGFTKQAAAYLYWYPPEKFSNQESAEVDDGSGAGITPS